MKKILSFILVLQIFFTSTISFAQYNPTLEKDPYFMENVYGFINSPDAEDIPYFNEEENLQYCAQVYLEATRRREYTQEELLVCGSYFNVKIKEELAFKSYMLNNRELFY